MAAPRTLLDLVVGWPERTQHRSRRNALLASTALTQQRIERDEVEAFLSAHTRRREAAGGAPTLPQQHRQERQEVAAGVI